MTSRTASFEETLSGMLTSVERDLLLPIIGKLGKGMSAREGKGTRKRLYKRNTRITANFWMRRETFTGNLDYYEENPPMTISLPTFWRTPSFRKYVRTWMFRYGCLKIFAGTCASWKAFVCKKGKEMTYSKKNTLFS